ncbi:tyrosine-type recombinase/integrase [Marinivivus vitaminiproducens]|uniref:tyrosine-type recombinase/integrase n=1 Tax=Marinivivus vitaminiproducens TaxID=3035935 RepID=UPI00279B0B7E|nr:tyrosine-type recombinase/integrase [Geminicoccaceae bacterium SCSIO 64248]
MSGFTVVRVPALVPFDVVDVEGNKQPDIADYLHSLMLNGRSVYTIRSYAFGLAHFHSWILANGVTLSAATSSHISNYITSYRVEGAAPGPATTNHRLTVVSGYYSFLIRARSNDAAWVAKKNPVPIVERADRAVPMRARPRRERADLRRRVQRRVHRKPGLDELEALFDAALSWRDRSILKLLEWSGQRIGDWSDLHDRHGVLGLALHDIDPSQRTITVRLKGSRQMHIVPVGEAFWPIYSEYLRVERGVQIHSAAWISFRKGGGRPLSYATFETTIRALRRRSGIHDVTAHTYRHTFAQNLLDTTGNLALLQAFLAHSSPETTAATYVHVPLERMVKAVRDLERRAALTRDDQQRRAYAFDYSAVSVRELERLFTDDRRD